MTGEDECRDQKILILYASQTGNAMDAAERVGREAERRGCRSAVVLSMDSYDVVSICNIYLPLCFNRTWSLFVI